LIFSNYPVLCDCLVLEHSSGSSRPGVWGRGQANIGVRQKCLENLPQISGVRRKFSGGFIQWHMVVICIWCALFMMSQFDVIFMFPNQRFGEVCWH